MKKQHVVFLAGVLLAVGFVLSGLFYQTERTAELDVIAQDNASTFVRDYCQTYGAADAKVTISEFFDPGCETCGQFYPMVKQLMAAHPGRIRLVMRYVPLHRGSDVMVRILEASRRQDKYWETLELMFQTQSVWASHHEPAPEKIWPLLPRAGLDVERIKSDMNDPAVFAVLDQDIADAKALRVSKTPEFFVNGKALPSFGFRQLAALVTSEIAAQY